MGNIKRGKQKEQIHSVNQSSISVSKKRKNKQDGEENLFEKECQENGERLSDEIMDLGYVDLPYPKEAKRQKQNEEKYSRFQSNNSSRAERGKVREGEGD